MRPFEIDHGRRLGELVHGDALFRKTFQEISPFSCHYFCMRIVILSLYRERLRQFTAGSADVRRFDDLMSRLRPLKAGRRFTRDEMNER
jgi:hypothetical protein